MSTTINDIDKDKLLDVIEKVRALSGHRVIFVTGSKLLKNIKYLYGYEVVYIDYFDDDKVFIIPQKEFVKY